MADTLPNTPLAGGQQVEVSTGLPTNKAVTVANVGQTDIHLTVKSTQPNQFDGWRVLTPNEVYFVPKNFSAIWCKSIGSDGLVNVASEG